MTDLAGLSDLWRYDVQCGSRFVVGCDEAGRGALAGPLVAAAVVFDFASEMPEALAKVNDSKKLTPAQRDQMIGAIEAGAYRVVIEIVSAEDIDQHGIDQANFGAMGRALEQACEALPEPATLLVDGHRYAHTALEHRIIKRGDSTSAAVAAASIVAKQHRDLVMQALDSVWPQWGFGTHKGYGTKAHRTAIVEHGVAPAHRRSFLTKILAQQQGFLTSAEQ